MSATDYIGAPGPMGATAQAGIDALREGRLYEFTRYHRVILPLDDFAFWVRGDLLTNSSLLDVPFSLFRAPSTLPLTIQVKGYTHVTTEQQQNPDESFAFSRVILTSEQAIEPFQKIAQEMMWIGEVDGVRYGFDSRSMFSRQAGLWHYAGDAIYPVTETQVIDDIAQLQPRALVLSNSIPLWLTLNSVCPIYPAFLLPDNLRPPYIAVNVESTQAMASTRHLTRDGSGFQQCEDTVRITTYGLRNEQIMQFTDAVNAYSMNYNLLGIRNVPVPYDERRQQNELNVLAQKKSIDYVVAYNQASIAHVARKFIKDALPVKVFPLPSA